MSTVCSFFNLAPDSQGFASFSVGSGANTVALQLASAASPWSVIWYRALLLRGLLPFLRLGLDGGFSGLSAVLTSA